MMKIALISGSYPPDICGVADYTKRLYEQLNKTGVNVSVYAGKRWGIFNAFRVHRELLKTRADVYHMQYPATGYGWKLGPHLLSLLQPLVMTIHECSRTHLLRRLSLLLFTIRARKIIFTNEFELRYAERFAPWIRKRSALVSIGNNIPLASGVSKTSDKAVTYFGLIRPQKGLEEVIEMARLFKARKRGVVVRVVGTVLPGNEGYFAFLRDQAKDLPLDWQLNLPDGLLSHALAETQVAYLPFPDGVSERRSSLIAMLANGAAVITTHGSDTPRDLCDIALFADSAEKAVSLAENLLNDPNARRDRQFASVKHSEKYSWVNIAQEHRIIYEKLLGQDR